MKKPKGGKKIIRKPFRIDVIHHPEDRDMRREAVDLGAHKSEEYWGEKSDAGTV